jgi:DNA-binding CsgD family transcriptional regulator/biotin operon repressor
MVASPRSSTAVPFGAAVPSLVRWGLSVDADLVFRTLVTFGARSQRDLATELGLSRQRVVDAVAELRAAGAAIAASANGGAGKQSPIWIPRPPAEVIAGLRARRMRLVDPLAQADHHYGLLRLLTERLGDAGVTIAPAAIAGTLSDHVRFYPNRKVARERQTELGRASQFDRLVINTEQSFEPAVVSTAGPLTKALVERNINIRILEPPPIDGDQYQPGEEFVNGTTYQHREAPQMPLKLIVLDRRTAFFPINALDYDRGYLEVTHPQVVDPLISVFESTWAAATDPRRYGVPQIMLSDREQKLIELLAEGHTDISAAQQLKISARSVTNIMRSLMDRVGVDNRFQLGLTLGTLRAAAPPPLTELITPTRPSLIR